MTTLQTADRVIQALFFLADGDAEGAGPTRVAEHLGVSKATAHNLLRSLEKHGLALFDVKAQKYALGPAIFRLAKGEGRYIELVDAARPVMEHLRDEIGETVTLHVRAGQQRMCIERFETRHILRRVGSVGESNPLHAGATGLVLLAWEDKETLDRILAYQEWALPTAQTPKDRAELEIELAKVRDLGYSIRRDDPLVGIGAVVAPVVSMEGRTLAALTVTWPTPRWDDDKINSCVPAILEAARQISSNFYSHRNGTVTVGPSTTFKTEPRALIGE